MRSRRPSRGHRCRTPATGRTIQRASVRFRFPGLHFPGLSLSMTFAFHDFHWNLALPQAFLNRSRFQGGDNGTRNFALAFRRAYSGDHFVVVVLRPLISGVVFSERRVVANVNKAPPTAEPYFLDAVSHDTRFFSKIPI